VYEFVAPTALRPDLPVIAMLPPYAEAGITAIELWAGDTPHIDISDPTQVRDLRQAAESLGIRVHCLHARFGDGADLGSLDETARREAVRVHRRTLEVAGELGARHVVVHPGHELASGAEARPHLLQTRRSVAELEEAARAAGTRLAVENMPRRLVEGVLHQWPGMTYAELALALGDSDPDVVGFCLDTGHAYLAGVDLPALIESFGARLHGIHLHDNRGEDDNHLLPGLGVIDWPPVLSALRRIGYALPITIEAHLPEGWSIPEALAHVRRLVAAPA
jgi:sugar phosphate isomerase/epimerase